MAAIRLNNLTKRYDDVTAVEDLSLEIEDGEFVVFVGPSGCGKSTTLRMISGLETISEGDLYIDGTRVNDEEPKDRDVAMVFQNYALYPHMSAKRNMTFGIKSSTSFSDNEIEQRVEDAADILGISELLGRKPKHLSGGERQRVAIGRAITRDPEVFLLDEPLSNLDAKLRVQMRVELSELHDELETTTIYVTHDQTEAMTLGDRVVVLNGGHLQQAATPQELYDFPANKFVAEFIGDPPMNLLPVSVETGGDTNVRGETFSISLGSVTPEGLDSSDALLGIRPEDIALAPKNGSTQHSVPVTVKVTEPLGETLLVYGDVEGTEIRFKLDPQTNVTEGETFDLVFDREQLHLFDPKTGAAVCHTQDGSVLSSSTVPN